MRRLIALLTVIIPLGAAAQAMVPDDDYILRATIDYESPYYYPSLMLRYEAGDTTLTREDYHYLYYGYAFQEAYKPLDPVQGEPRVLALLEAYPEPDSLQAAELVHAAIQVFRQDPFSPRNINFLAYGYAMMGDSVNAAVNADRLEKILWVIGNSGTGLNEKSPRHVLWFAHTNDFIAAQGSSIESRLVKTKTVEYVRLTEKDENNLKGYYFDFGRIYRNSPDNPVRNRRSEGFELNGIRLGRNRNTDTPTR